MRHGIHFLALAGTIASAACGPTELTINAQMEVAGAEGTEVRPLADMEVQLLPFDRDAIFDSLARESGTAEPEIPADLLEAQNQVAEAQGEWQRLESEWSLLREDLLNLTGEMERLNPAEAQYRVLFMEFDEKEQRLAQVERQRDAAFEEFTTIQGSMIEQADQVRMLREMWGDEAFADYGVVAEFMIDVSGLDPIVDTTDASGSVVTAAPAGQYWVYARWERSFDELYWNVPLMVEGEPVTFTLDESNAQVRPIL
ncbi:MAG: hypothetical protein OXE73_09175 [Gammaproteobacteria bacterium]|nr:hypothetical protein [Gammaproteobacteria bacterium]